MDKENKKERDKARKAFNDIVRRLALYIKKNDPRVKVFLEVFNEIGLVRVLG